MLAVESKTKTGLLPIRKKEKIHQLDGLCIGAAVRIAQVIMEFLSAEENMSISTPAMKDQVQEQYHSKVFQAVHTHT
jgi:hypothetical protein